MSETNNATPVIACAGLNKTYQNGVTALNELTLSIERGMSFGLMGENGAGKSTLVRLLMGFIFPTKGRLAGYWLEKKELLLY